MKNRDIYLKDPSVQKLVNEGVANVNDDMTSEALAVLRYELETFVCDGQYEKGLEHVLETYLKNIEQAQQPAVWISGFYGSGKSHLVKMLRALWVDTTFEDGATARGIASLPQNITDLSQRTQQQWKTLWRVCMPPQAPWVQAQAAVFGWRCCGSFSNRSVFLNNTLWLDL